MIPITASNVNEAYPLGLLYLREQAVAQRSQHGVTLEMPEPVSVLYKNPRERILFEPLRDSNPFLNFFEALWILAARSDVSFLQTLVPNMAKYSDDGYHYYGAYGARMRFNVDQIHYAIKRLKANPDDRQVVLTIRQQKDIFYEGKDNPCNLMVSCKIRNGKLNIHVFNRSNDFIWGLTGTNVVQFSMLQEYLAGHIGCEVGTYHQTTDSMHVYVNEQWEKLKNTGFTHPDPYHLGQVQPYDMMRGVENWDKDLHRFFKQFDARQPIDENIFYTPFFLEVVLPMWKSFEYWQMYRDGTDKQPETLRIALVKADSIKATDWKLAVQEWLQRRVKP